MHTGQLNLAVVAVAAVTAALLAPPIGPAILDWSGPPGIPPGDAPDPVGPATPVAGSQLSMDRPGAELSWIDFAVPVTADLQQDDIDVEVTYTLTDPGASEEQQFWLFAYAGPRIVEELKSPAHWRWLMYVEDGEIEVGGQVLGQSQEVGAPSPFCERGWCWPGPQWNVTIRFDHIASFLKGMREDYENPVAHLFFMAGGLEPTRTRVEASFDNTTANTTHGGFADTFTYYREDFHSTAFVQADVPRIVQPYAQVGASLQLDLVDPGPYTFFHYLPLAGTPAQEDPGAGYERPDGSKPFFYPVGVGQQPGTWRFWFNASSRWWNPFSTGYGDQQVLMGTNFDWAEAPPTTESAT